MVKTYQIHELLYMSPQKYAEKYEDTFFRWCQNLAKNDKSDTLFQQYFGNSALSKWFLENYELLEKQFVQMVAPNHTSMHYMKVRKIYDDVVEDIFREYPGALLEAATKVRIINNLN